MTGLPMAWQKGRTSMTMQHARAYVACILCVAAFLVEPHPASSQDGDAVARVGQRQITEVELERFVGNRLIQVRSQEYLLTRRVLDELITERLLREEAERLGITSEQFDERIRASVAEVTDHEVKLVYEATRDRYFDLDEAGAIAAVAKSMRDRRFITKRREVVDELRAKRNVVVLLEPPRVVVAEADSPSKGKRDAAVTLIEFSDYQCPYCAKMQSVIKELQARFPNDLRVVFRDFPLPNHPHAKAAAEAAHCAGEQGKFWEMHDKLFSNQSRLAPAVYSKLARELTLNDSRFEECIKSERFADRWRSGERDGRAYGVTGTPTFFLNGRYLSGLVPLELLVETVKDEIAAESRTRAMSRRQ